MLLISEKDGFCIEKLPYSDHIELPLRISYIFYHVYWHVLIYVFLFGLHVFCIIKKE